MAQGFKSKKSTSTPKITDTRHSQPSSPTHQTSSGDSKTEERGQSNNTLTQERFGSEVFSPFVHLLESIQGVTGDIEQMVVSKSVGKLTIMKHLKEAEKNPNSKSTK
ncbi:hypothetical protein KEM48_009738 [Puccinia striiformis f. sp. tritici PST-130]|nr:hypothetical protein KEM48_009738 [Puccinia striiformis f. sp. tritici PST-130]